MSVKTLKAFAVIGEGYSESADELEVASTDGVQLGVFTTVPAATERLEFDGEQVLPVVIVSFADFERITAERDTLQLSLNTADQRIDELVSAVRSINHAKRHEVIVPGDDEPQYRQRKEWVHWVLSLCDEASASEPCHEIPGTSGMRLNMLANQGE